MKTYTFHYSNHAELNLFLEKKQIPDSNQTLIFVFCGNPSLTAVKDVQAHVRALMPNSLLIGATSAGEILDGQLYDGSIVISFSVFTETKLKLISFPYIYRDYELAGKEFAHQLCSDSTKVAFILATAFNTNGEDFVRGIGQVRPDVCIAGGLAGTRNGIVKKTYVFSNQDIFSEGAIGVALDNPNLHVHNYFNFDWTPLGKELIVTHAEKNRVYTIDHQIASDVYKKYLGMDIVDSAYVYDSGDFPLIISRQGTQIGRSGTRCHEDGSVSFGGNLREGDRVRFGFGNAEMIVSSAQRSVLNLEDKPVESIFVFSCLGRKSFMPDHIQIEIHPLQSFAPTVGFFTFGEFFHTPFDNEFLNHSMTVLALSESDEIPNHEEQFFLFSPETHTLNNLLALSHLVKVTSEELKERNTELQLTQAKLQNITHNMGEGLLAVNENNEITYANSMAETISGFTQEEMLGRNFISFFQKNFNGLDLFEFLRKMRTSLEEKKEHVHDELTFMDSSGNRKIIAFTSAPLFTHSRFSGSITVFRDITHIKAQERELESTYTLLKEYKRAMDEGTIISKTDLDGRITYMNDKFCEITGFSRDELIGSTHQRLHSPFTPEEKQIALWNTVRQKRTWHGIFDYQNKDGHIFYVDETIIPILDENGEIIEFIGLWNDITKLHEAIERSKVAERTKSEFLANMSHEIRTPLNSIQGFVELMTRTPLNRTQREYLTIIQSSTKTLLSIINDILDFSKIESGKLEIESVPFNPLKEFESTIELFTAKANEKDIHLLSYIDPEIPQELIGDPLRVKQVLTNLLSNAVKFSYQEGIICVEIRKIGTLEKQCSLYFSVLDNGPGIPEEKQERIFDAFTQAELSVARNFGGTGLGLAISANLIHLMNGTLQLKSQLNKGSEFYFDLAFDTPSPDVTYLQEYALPSLRVGILDYAEKNLSHEMYIKRYLESLHCQVTRFTDFHEFSPANFDVMVLVYDAQIEEQIWKLQRCTLKPIILVAKETQRATVEKFDNLHSRTIFQPINASKLFDAISGMIYHQTKHERVLGIPETEETFQGNALIVEDNPTNQKLIKLMLEELGLATILADHGEAGVEAVLSNQFDIIFMDINMPYLDGVGATRKILNYEQLNQQEHTPIIALTANAVKGDREKFLSSGMDDYLAKPVSMKAVRSILRRYLKFPTPTDSNASSITTNCFSFGQVAQELGLDESMVLFLVKDFVSSSEPILKNLEVAIQQNDLQTVAKASHSLKGAAGNLRLSDIARLAQQCETHARNEKDVDYYELFKTLEQKIQYLAQEVQA